jgi:WD40 repeat protein
MLNKKRGNVVQLRGWFLLFVGLLVGISAMAQSASPGPERGHVVEIAVSGNGRVMAVAYFDSYAIDFFDTLTMELLATGDTSQSWLSQFALDHSGNRLVGLNDTGGVAIYDRRDDTFTALPGSWPPVAMGQFKWSPTNESVLAYIEGDDLRFVNVDTGDRIGRIRSTIKNSIITDFSFHPDGRGVVTSAAVPAHWSETTEQSLLRSAIEIWERFPEAGEILSTPDISLTGFGGGTVAWSPDGQRIAAHGLSGLSVYNVSEERMEATHMRADPDPEAYEFAWSPDGQYIVMNGYFITLFDTTNYSFVGQVIDAPSARELVWSPDGKTVYGQDLSGPGGVGVFDVSALARPATTSLERGHVTQIAVSGDGHVMAVSYAGSYPIDFFDTSTMELLATWDTSQSRWNSFTLDQTGNRLIGTNNNTEGLVIYDRRDGSSTVLRTPRLFPSSGLPRWSPTDPSVIAHTDGAIVAFLNVDTEEYLGVVNSTIGTISDFAFYPDGNGIVTSALVPGNILSDIPPRMGVEIWNQLPRPGEVLNTPRNTLDGIGGKFIGWSPDGQRIAILGASGLSIYNVAQDRLEATNLHTEPDSMAWKLAWSPDGQYIATNGVFIALWDATAYTFVGQVSEAPSNSDLVWSPDGNTIYGQDRSGPGGVGIFHLSTDLRTGTPVFPPLAVQTTVPSATPTPSLIPSATSTP